MILMAKNHQHIQREPLLKKPMPQMAKTEHLMITQQKSTNRLCKVSSWDLVIWTLPNRKSSRHCTMQRLLDLKKQSKLQLGSWLEIGTSKNWDLQDPFLLATAQTLDPFPVEPEKKLVPSGQESFAIVISGFDLIGKHGPLPYVKVVDQMATKSRVSRVPQWCRPWAQ